MTIEDIKRVQIAEGRYSFENVTVKAPENQEPN